MATRSSSDAGASVNTRVDEYSRDYLYCGGGGGDDDFSSTTAAASSSASSRTSGNSSQREDESHYFSTSSPPSPESAILSEILPVSGDRNSSDANDDGDTYSDITQGIQTFARSSTKKPHVNLNSSTDDTVTTNCLGSQMEMRACLDANDNRESMCMWHFRMWQKCKTEQQEFKTTTKFGALGL